MPAYITGLGICLPNKPVHNEKIESLLGKVGNVSSPVRDMILGRNGINWRYYAVDPDTGKPTHTNAQLTAQAVYRLAEDAALDVQDIRLLVCGTSSPDRRFLIMRRWSTGCWVAHLARSLLPPACAAPA